MIKYVPYREIDRVKYDNCIEESDQGRVYALSWYLDCVTEGWDVLVQGDYEFVMPVPRKAKYGIRYVYTPSWVQQLGIFSRSKIPEEKTDEFLKVIQGKFFWMDYHLNSGNPCSSKALKPKKNYILHLGRELEEIQKSYNSNRRRNSRTAGEGLDLDKEGDANVFFENYRSQSKPYVIAEQAIEQLYCLCMKKNDHVRVWNVFLEGKFAAGLIWLIDSRRITYLLPVSDKRARELDIPTYIINELIREFQQRDLLLDFEGSMLSGVEKFYQSFGAKPESYLYFKKRIVPYV